MPDKIDREAVIARVQKALDLANTPRCKLDDIRTNLRNLEAFVTTTGRRPRSFGLMGMEEFLKAKIEKYTPTFFGGKG